MIEPAQLWTEEINRKYTKTWYDPKYRFYVGGGGSYEITVADNNVERHQFAIIEKDEVIGYVGYRCNWLSGVVDNLGAICFKDKPSLIFARDLFRILDRVFTYYNFNKIEFWAVSGNPILDTYRKLIKKYGGREVGTFRQSVKTNDNVLHDAVMFELFADDYLNHCCLE